MKVVMHQIPLTYLLLVSVSIDIILVKYKLNLNEHRINMLCIYIFI